MNIPETIFKIIEDHQCPLYELGDIFSVSGRSNMLPPGKPACMVLMIDMRLAVAKYESLDDSYTDKNLAYRFICSGNESLCTGTVRVEARVGKRILESKDVLEKYEKIRSIITALAKFPIFRGLNEQQLKELGSFLRLEHFDKDDIIIKKGDPGINLFIIASGKVEVIGDRGIKIAVLEKGEIFGEMSLISGQPVGATVKVVEAVNLLYINGKDFVKILELYPSVQIYFARLLATRLAKTNIDRIEDMASGMSGTLSEIQPVELFQSLNVNQKTGAAELSLKKGTARVCFRNGELINAEYEDSKGSEAFFTILREKEGRFKFNSNLLPEEENLPVMGEFMWLLMEGVRKIDETSEV